MEGVQMMRTARLRLGNVGTAVHPGILGYSAMKVRLTIAKSQTRVQLQKVTDEVLSLIF